MTPARKVTGLAARGVALAAAFAAIGAVPVAWGQAAEPAPAAPAATAPAAPQGLSESVAAVVNDEIISTYDKYGDAKHAVDVLARAGFPVGQVSIVGNDVRSVERVTGRLTYGRVAWMGALSGAGYSKIGLITEQALQDQ